MNNRQEKNREILAVLAELIENCPELRFCQLLYGLDIVKEDVDSFYEESKVTLDKIQQTKQRFI